MTQKHKIILASSSPYRRDLLMRLGLEFTAISPSVDETPLAHETPENLVLRLAQLKAEKIATFHPDSIIIGSDQVACLQNRILGKPGNHKNATEQLRSMCGQSIRFLTSLYVQYNKINYRDSTIVSYQVQFRAYSHEEIEKYLLKEKPYSSAGSFKSENLGVTLIQSMSGNDPTALIGLPLIKTAELLRECGLEIP